METLYPREGFRNHAWKTYKRQRGWMEIEVNWHPENVPTPTLFWPYFSKREKSCFLENDNSVKRNQITFISLMIALTVKPISTSPK